MPTPILVGSSTSGRSLVNSLNTTVAAFRDTMEAEPLMPSLSSRMPLNPGEGESKLITTFGKMTAHNITEGVDITKVEDLTDSRSTYSPSLVGVKVVVTELSARRTADRTLPNRLGRLMGQAVARKRDEHAFAQFSSFTTGLGAASAVLAMGHLNSGAARVEVGNSLNDPEPYGGNLVGVFHPCNLTALVGNLIPLSTGGNQPYQPDAGAGAQANVTGVTAGWQENVVRRGWAGVGKTLMGVSLYKAFNITVDSSNDAIGALYNPQGLIYVPEVEFQPLPARERDVGIGGVGVILVIQGSYVWGLYRAAATGVSMTFDATLPTS